MTKKHCKSSIFSSQIFCGSLEKEKKEFNKRGNSEENKNLFS